MTGWRWRIAACILAASEVGCSGYSPKSNFTLPSIPFLTDATGSTGDPTKATALISASIAGLTCAESRIVLARAEGSGFQTAQIVAINSQFGGGAGAVVASLDPGTYHIVHVACRNGNSVVSVGGAPGSQAVPWAAQHWDKALATFAVAAGEVIDTGELQINPVSVQGFSSTIANRKATPAVKVSGTRALSEITKLGPETGAKLHNIPMVLASTAPLTIAKCRLVAPEKPLPKDGSSNLPDLVAQHPAAGPIVAAIGTGTMDADRCVPENGSLNPVASAAAAAALAAGGAPQ